jgi:branched-chain amino acid aminotransferase
MKKWKVFLNGKFVDAKDAAISVFDRGFSCGDGVFEVIRTFGHKLLYLDEHVERLERSLNYLRIRNAPIASELTRIFESVLCQNTANFEAENDYELWQVISRGEQRIGRRQIPNTTAYCIPINFRRFAERHTYGSKLVIPRIRRTPPECVSPQVKLSDRTNQLCALLEVQENDMGVLPLMLDVDGFIAETHAANFFFVKDGQVCTPRCRNALEGIARKVTMSMAPNLGLSILEGDFTLEDLASASEAFTTSTIECVVPVHSVNGRHFEAGLPGPVTGSFIHAWNRLAGFDLVHQARSNLNGLGQNKSNANSNS